MSASLIRGTLFAAQPGFEGRNGGGHLVDQCRGFEGDLLPGSCRGVSGGARERRALPGQRPGDVVIPRQRRPPGLRLDLGIQGIHLFLRGAERIRGVRDDIGVLERGSEGRPGGIDLRLGRRCAGGEQERQEDDDDGRRFFHRCRSSFRGLCGHISNIGMRVRKAGRPFNENRIARRKPDFHRGVKIALFWPLK